VREKEMSRSFEIGKGFLHAMEMWFDEPGREVLKKKVCDNIDLGKKDTNLALKTQLLSSEEYVDLEREVKDKMRLLSEKNSCISWIVKRLNCSYAIASVVFRHFSSHLSAQQNDNYQT
jgi:hypothetical protein